MLDNRRVHASGTQMEVVRYDRQGKWYLEPKNKSLPRQHVTIQAAVDYAYWLWYNDDEGTPYFGRPGGSRFDHLLRKKVEDVQRPLDH